MPVTAVRPLVLGDPALLWLQYHGAAHGFAPAETPYDFLAYVAGKSAQFEAKWTHEMAPTAPQVCASPTQVHDRQKVLQTIALMRAHEPVILQPALWWPPEKVYGVPDALVQVGWFVDKHPRLASLFTAGDMAQSHYLVMDLKFSSDLENALSDLDVYSAQLRLYSYMLGQLQAHMPSWAFLVTRDRIFDPIAVPVRMVAGQPLDGDLARWRDVFLEIKLNGARYTPWSDALVASDITNADEEWQAAKKTIALARLPGRDPALLPWIGATQKQELAQLGFTDLDALLAVEPEQVPLEQCAGLGGMTAKRIRAVLAANRSGKAIAPPAALVPTRRRHEYYVDFEYLTNLNVDFAAQWPTLEGREMIFMVGVGWDEGGEWRFKVFIAQQETRDAELAMLEEFVAFLQAHTGEARLDADSIALYHWSAAEQWQAQNTADRHQLGADHPLRHLPWVDLVAEVALAAPIGVPGAWNYKLKSMARSLGALNPAYDPHWPGDLDEGKRAMVMGWKAYEAENPLAAPEMPLLIDYLEADCRAIWKILQWMRASVEGSQEEPSKRVGGEGAGR